MGSWWRAKNDLKEENETPVMRNGRMLLEKLIASFDGKCNPIQVFTAEELKTATDNYDPQNILTSDSGYKLYKGLLRGRPVSIKKFKENDNQYQYSLNDIAFASQMSVHKNFLKLLGCCLETQIPTLVFEHVLDGTLADRIYGPNKAHFQPLLWIQRLKIALDMANATAYLHTAFSRPIVFRNIKPLNILLDEHHVAKLSDFSIAVSVPEGQSHVWDLVTGATGLIAPEYMSTSKFNEKQDVFNFGVFLLVLLTGQMVVDASRSEADGEVLLMCHVKKHIEDDRFNRIVDPAIIGEGCWPSKEQQLEDFTAVALKCISDTAEGRPTMIDVAKELRQIYKSASSR